MDKAFSDEAAIKLLREASILLIFSNVLLLVALNFIILLAASIITLATFIVKIIPSASFLAHRGEKFSVTCMLIKAGYWGSLALESLTLLLR